MSKKICLLADSLSSGGAERMVANLSKSFTKKGYDITIVTMIDDIGYKYNGRLYNYGVIKKHNSKLIAFVKFYNFFKDNDFDFIIDHRVRNKFVKEILFSKMVFKNMKVIYCIHSYRLSYYFSHLKISCLAKFPHVKMRRFISVSKEIVNITKEKIRLESEVIYNYSNPSEIDTLANSKSLDFNDDFIIGVGRFTSVKQFDKLLKAYSNSDLSKAKIKLVILGNGPKEKQLKDLALKLKCTSDVIFIPFQNNPYPFMKKAKALILSSKFEGFPMVILEALFLKTPVIAFDVKSGPKEIIVNGINGILVDKQNEKALTSAMNKMIFDKDLIRNINQNIETGLESFSEKNSIQNWERIFENFK